jgi:hypothetical protein
MTPWDTFCLSDEGGTHLKRQSFPVRSLNFIDNVLQDTLQEVGGALGNLRCHLSRKRKSVCLGGHAPDREVDFHTNVLRMRIETPPLPAAGTLRGLALELNSSCWPPVTLSSHEISSEPIQEWGRWMLRSSEQRSPLIVRRSLVKNIGQVTGYCGREPSWCFSVLQNTWWDRGLSYTTTISFNIHAFDSD